MKSSTPGSTVNFTIDGTVFRIIGYKSNTQGKFDVAIDGEFVARNISLYDTSVNTLFQNIVYTSNKLTPGKHTVTIVHSSKNMYLDAIETDGAIMPLEEVTEFQCPVTNCSPPAKVMAVPSSAVITTGPSLGTAAVNGSFIEYTPYTFLGSDSDTIEYTANGKSYRLIITAADTVRYEETFPEFTYEGTWSILSNSNLSGGAASSIPVSAGAGLVRFWGWEKQMCITG